jgi:dephospho-CoA kinase
MSLSYPIQVGVTGGIGSGKSVVCKIFNCLGVPVYNADERAKWLTGHDADLRKEVIDLLGAKAYRPDGTYNRPYVAAQVFPRPDLLQQLNQIIHPRVHADSDHWLRQQSRQPYVIREAALMNRAGDRNTLHYVIVVVAPLQVRIERIRKRDPERSLDEINAIISRQITDEARRELADFIIDNDVNSALIPQVAALHDFFMKKDRLS